MKSSRLEDSSSSFPSRVLGIPLGNARHLAFFFVGFFTLYSILNFAALIVFGNFPPWWSLIIFSAAIGFALNLTHPLYRDRNRNRDFDQVSKVVALFGGLSWVLIALIQDLEAGGRISAQTAGVLGVFSRSVSGVIFGFGGMLIVYLFMFTIAGLVSYFGAQLGFELREALSSLKIIVGRSRKSLSDMESARSQLLQAFKSGLSQKRRRTFVASRQHHDQRASRITTKRNFETVGSRKDHSKPAQSSTKPSDRKTSRDSQLNLD